MGKKKQEVLPEKPKQGQVITPEEINLRLALQRQKIALAKMRGANAEVELADMEVEICQTMLKGKAEQIQKDMGKKE